MKVPERYYDEIFDFAGQWDVPSKCGLKILPFEGKTVVIATELYQDNPGSSVTYASGNLLQQILERKGLDRSKVIYLECNPNTNSKLSFYDEEFFLVTLNIKDGQISNPIYRQLNSEEIKTLITLCHPDKHQQKESAVKMTQKLLSMR